MLVGVLELTLKLSIAPHHTPYASGFIPTPLLGPSFGIG